MESLDFYRRSTEVNALRVNGYSSLGNLHASKPPAAHAEQRISELPVYASSQQPMQDSVTGRRFWIAGLDPVSDTYHPRRA